VLNSPSSYQVAFEKPLSTEQLVASVVQAVGDGETVGVLPEMLGAAKTDDSDAAAVASDGPTTYLELRERFAKAFAAPPRTAEVEHSPSVKAALFLMNDEVVLDWLEPQGNNLVARLTKQDDNQQLAEELYLSVLSRIPADEEVTEVADHLSERSQDRSAACGELVWALLASTEFGVNH
jgi:hypothetical protein